MSRGSDMFRCQREANPNTLYGLSLNCETCGGWLVQAAMLCAINKYCETLIMVGDHKQLPPTLMSDCVYVLGQSGTRSSHKLNQSLFERLIVQEMPYRMLDTQYRMHPAIAEFPSMRVYDGKLLTGITAEARPIPRGFPWPNPEIPVAFLGAHFTPSRPVHVCLVVLFPTLLLRR